VALYQPSPKQVPSETVNVANETRPDMGWTDTTQDTIAGNSLDKYEARESFGINHRGGSPKVSSGEDRTTHEVVGQTDVRKASLLRPALPKNIYTPPPGTKTP